jgi:hypothetical protein
MRKEGTIMSTEQEHPHKYYRKITPTVARVLTELDYQIYQGIIQTREGPKVFLPGDYLAKDGLGCWPIPIETMRAHYERVGAADKEGYVTFRSGEVREAVQMPSSFTINGLTGQPGDYLVFGHGSAWPVERSQFERSYAPLEESVEGQEGRKEVNRHERRMPGLDRTDGLLAGY